MSTTYDLYWFKAEIERVLPHLVGGRYSVDYSKPYTVFEFFHRDSSTWIEFHIDDNDDSPWGYEKDLMVAYASSLEAAIEKHEDIWNDQIS